MTLAPALACPSCKRTLGPESWIDAHHGTCFRCKTDYEFFGFPALNASRTKVAAQTAMLAEDSVCFFHAENRAEAVCEGCGRLLCPVCAVPFGGQKICPTCIAATKTSEAPQMTRSRVLFDGIALMAAGLPLLLWPFTLVTAPFALGMVIYGWKQPGSLVRGPSRVRFIIAGLLAAIQIGVWVTFGVIWLSRR
jgi:hypothetical protein